MLLSRFFTPRASFVNSLCPGLSYIALSELFFALNTLKNIEGSARFNRGSPEMTDAVYMTPIDSSPMLRTPFPITPVLVFIACQA